MARTTVPWSGFARLHSSLNIVLAERLKMLREHGNHLRCTAHLSRTAMCRVECPVRCKRRGMPSRTPETPSLEGTYPDLSDARPVLGPSRSKWPPETAQADSCNPSFPKLYPVVRKVMVPASTAHQLRPLRAVQDWQLIGIPRPISSYCFYKDNCHSPNLYPNLLQLPILHLGLRKLCLKLLLLFLILSYYSPTL